MNTLQSTYTDNPQFINRVSEFYDPTFPPNWFVVFPKGTTLGFVRKDKAMACFFSEKHALEFSKKWEQFVEIIKNGEA